MCFISSRRIKQVVTKSLWLSPSQGLGQLLIKWKGERGGKKKNREGTLGMTRQAGGAGCLSDDDVEMKSDVSNQGESSDGSKIWEWNKGFKSLEKKNSVHVFKCLEKKKKSFHLANANSVEVDLWKKRLANTSRITFLIPPHPSDLPTACTHGRFPVPDCFPTLNNTEPVARDSAGCTQSRWNLQPSYFGHLLKKINASQQKQCL